RSTGLRTSFDHPQVCGGITCMALGGGALYVSGGCQNVVAVDATSGAMLPWSLELHVFPEALFSSGSTLYVGGGSIAVGNRLQTGLLAVSQADRLTPTLGEFDAQRTTGGVLLEWRLTG